MKNLKNVLALSLIMLVSFAANSQSFLKKKEKKAYKCGYVHKESFFKKLKPMKLISKATGAIFKAKAKSDLNDVALSVGYASGLVPKSQVDFATKTPGWETCGEGVSVFFLNYNGIGFTDTDGDVKVNGEKLKKAGMGTYFKGYGADKRGPKQIQVTSSTGDNVDITIEPAAPLEIISVNGVKKGGDIIITGKEDIVIELKGGDADPNSELYVEMIISAMSLKVQSHLFPSKPTNRIVIPKEALKNFENSPLPIIKKNTLSVTRVKNELIYNTDAGIIQKTATFSDFTPVLMDGDFSGGSLITNSFSKKKNTSVTSKFKTVEGEYNVKLNKGNAYTHPPTSRMKNVGIMSFVVRGNLFKKKTTTSTTRKTNFNVTTITTTRTTVSAWFPELTDNTWQLFANKLYDKLEATLKQKYGINVIPVDKVISSKAYSSMKPVKDTVTKTFVEKGAYGTKRMLSTNFRDILKDIKTTFAGDHSNEKMMRELGLDGLIAVTVDLDFELKTKKLNPVIKIVAFSPNVTYRTGGKYFEMNFSTKAKQVKDVNSYNAIVGGPEDVIYKVIKGDDFFNAFDLAMKELRKGEGENSAYFKIWKDRM